MINRKTEIYELPIEIHKELILSRWNDFVNKYNNEDKIIVFECCFIQNQEQLVLIFLG